MSKGAHKSRGLFRLQAIVELFSRSGIVNNEAGEEEENVEEIPVEQLGEDCGFSYKKYSDIFSNQNIERAETSWRNKTLEESFSITSPVEEEFDRTVTEKNKSSNKLVKGIKRLKVLSNSLDQRPFGFKGSLLKSDSDNVDQDSDSSSGLDISHKKKRKRKSTKTRNSKRTLRNIFPGPDEDSTSEAATESEPKKKSKGLVRGPSKMNVTEPELLEVVENDKEIEPEFGFDEPQLLPTTHGDTFGWDTLGDDENNVVLSNYIDQNVLPIISTNDEAKMIVFGDTIGFDKKEIKPTREILKPKFKKGNSASMVKLSKKDHQFESPGTSQKVVEENTMNEKFNKNQSTEKELIEPSTSSNSARPIIKAKFKKQAKIIDVEVSVRRSPRILNKSQSKENVVNPTIIKLGFEKKSKLPEEKEEIVKPVPMTWMNKSQFVHKGLRHYL